MAEPAPSYVSMLIAVEVLACAGATAVIRVALTFEIDAAGVLPNVTLVVFVRLVPLIVTVVPPATGPPVGVTDVIVGTAT